MRRPSIPFEAKIGFRVPADIAASQLEFYLLAATETSMQTQTTDDPNKPTQVPPGDLSDAVRTTPGDFVEDGEDMDEDDNDDDADEDD